LQPGETVSGVADAASIPEVRDPSRGEFFTRFNAAFSERLLADVAGNIDADRWIGFPAAAPAERERAFAAVTLPLLVSSLQDFDGVYELLADSASRELFVQLVLYRLLGHRHVLLPRNNDEHWAQRDRAIALQGVESQYSGLFGRFRRFELDFESQPIVAECHWGNIAWTFFLRQYYLERGPVVVRPQPGDCVIDAGACYGDTALAFAASVGAEGRVYAFEIDPPSLQVIRHNVALNPELTTRIALCEQALGDFDGQRYLHGSGPGAMVLDHPGGHPVSMTTLDTFVEQAGISRVDFIKMDIEGAELGALQGASKTLARFKPRLAISLYHRPTDILRIPLWLSQRQLGYEFYLEHYTIHHEETVLYALPGNAD